MAMRDLQTKLTPTAREALEELVTDYREKTLLAAYREAASLTSDPQEISLRDLLAARDTRAGKRLDPKSASRLQRYRLFAVAGILYALLGVGFIIFQTIDWELTGPTLIGLMLTAAGLVISAFSYSRYRDLQISSTWGSIRTSIDMSYADRKDPMVFVAKWRDLEFAMKQLIARTYGESAARGPISEQFNLIQRVIPLDAGDVSDLRDLLRLRNSILHEAVEPADESLERALRKANNLITRLQKAVRP